MGRQVITLDNHRYVGHVGWRQDRQTFDAATIVYKASKHLKASYSYLTKRNRIFGEVKDIDSKDHLLNLSYKTDLGQLTAYSYLLEVDNGTSNSLDTFGANFKGKKDKFSYYAEIATQNADSSTTDYSATYMALEGGYSFDAVTVKLGAEILGSDDAMFGFSTPLATLHKFNGWSDQFLNTPTQGLKDFSATISTRFAGGKWTAIYHQFDADEAAIAIDDFGTGYCSFSYLKNYAIDYLKIDKSFIQKMSADTKDAALCEAIIVMASKLNIDVIAEGIETVQQKEFLTQVGCLYGQGYLLAMPMSDIDFEQLLTKDTIPK